MSGKKETVLDLGKYIDKGVRVKLSGGREGASREFPRPDPVRRRSAEIRRPDPPNSPSPASPTPVTERRASAAGLLVAVLTPAPLPPSLSPTPRSDGSPQGFRPAPQPRA